MFEDEIHRVSLSSGNLLQFAIEHGQIISEFSYSNMVDLSIVL